MIGRDIYEKLMREIAAGKFAEDGKLPSELELGKAFKASRMTVRGALAELQRQGLVEKRIEPVVPAARTSVRGLVQRDEKL